MPPLDDIELHARETTANANLPSCIFNIVQLSLQDGQALLFTPGSSVAMETES